MHLLAHISDPHIDGTDRATERATRVMDYVRSLPRQPDAVLVSGDIAHRAEPAEYEEAARIFAAGAQPVIMTPGNHDLRAPYRKVLLGDGDGGDGRDGGDSDNDGEAPINSLHHIGDLALLACDSSIPGRGEGLLEPATLDWISDSLDSLGPDTPALLAFHHPPVRLHHPYIDGIMLRNGDELAALIADRPQVLAVLVGHAHTPAATTFAGRPLLVAPGVHTTLNLPWQEADHPVDRDLPPGLAFHVIDDDRRITTHFRVVP
ncbi:phosphodiesterase [Streptomyces sp. A7024]|uniref:Phosphodiesterase n=1 Tax=Streptomyces coryli TaxID=1128680 RepID=A0A6G4U8H2_9ACTN|nr:metallophosphoesterase [Streptomyces coryli]NGN68484.1 phosphodiesterase [Streptomyces coryli]